MIYAPSMVSGSERALVRLYIRHGVNITLSRVIPNPLLLFLL
jgi:hypothetical protein